MNFDRKLPDVDVLQQEYPLNVKLQRKRQEKIEQICKVLSGKDDRKLILVGPCSADREDAVLEYTTRLAKLQNKVEHKLILVPRVYTSKPRTKGTGYKGILHNPQAKRADDLFEGIIATRKLHLHVIEESGLFAVDEMLYPEEMYYIMDLLAYLAVGARSVEDQGHRMTASGANIPTGMKNPTGGSFTALLNSVSAAQHAHSMIYRGWEVSTEGNPYAHAILRGYTDLSGKDCPNYHYEDLCELFDLAQKMMILNPAVIVDCNHANSHKNYEEQVRIAKDVFGSCKNRAINSFVKGLMIESYLEDGCQLVGGNVYGKSITDSCLGWKKTERLILELAEMT